MFRELQRLHDQVFFFPRDEHLYGGQPNIGIIKGTRQTLLIDAGNSPRHARQVLASMAGMGFAPVHTLIYTHHHWEQTFGASYYRARLVVGHEETARTLATYASRTWNPSAVRDWIARNPKQEAYYQAMLEAIPDWRDFAIVTPNLRFSRQLDLYVDDLLVEVWHIGGHHAPDACIVKLPQVKIMFLGDCYFAPPLPVLESGESSLDLPLLERLLLEAYDWYVDGRNTPYSYAQFHRLVLWERERRTGLA